MTDEIKPCIHAEVCAEGCDLEDITECGYYRAERTCKNVEYDSASKFECSECGFSVATVPDGPSDWLTFAWSYCPSCSAKVME